MAKVGIDLDGVVSNFDKAFLGHIKNVFPKKEVPANYMPIDWHWSNLLKPEEEDILWKELNSVQNFWLTTQPYQENLTALDRFISRNADVHDVWFVTSRAKCSGKTIASQSIQWLDNHMKYTEPTDHRGVIVVKKSDFKKQVLEGIGAQYMIDDYGPTIEMLDQVEGLDACLLDRPWNQDAKVKTRVNSMSEFLKRIK